MLGHAECGLLHNLVLQRNALVVVVIFCL